MGRGEDRYRHHHHSNHRRHDRSGSKGHDTNRRPYNNQRYCHGSSNIQQHPLRHSSPGPNHFYPTSQVSPFILPTSVMPMGPVMFDQYPQMPHHPQMQNNPSPFIQGFLPQSPINNSMTTADLQDCGPSASDPRSTTDHSSMMPIVRSSHRSRTPPKISLERLNLAPEKITETGIIPDLPYYELPAALMVPLVGPSQTEYSPIKPSDLRLPFPKFPDEQFLKTIDQFYKKDDKPRDDGWDREFIDTFIKQKKAISESSHIVA